MAPGDRIAQLLFLPLTDVRLVRSDLLDDTTAASADSAPAGTGERQP